MLDTTVVVLCAVFAAAFLRFAYSETAARWARESWEFDNT